MFFYSNGNEIQVNKNKENCSLQTLPQQFLKFDKQQ